MQVSFDDGVCVTGRWPAPLAQGRHRVTQATLIAQSNRRFTLSSTACGSLVSAGATPADFQGTWIPWLLDAFRRTVLSLFAQVPTFRDKGMSQTSKSMEPLKPLLVSPPSPLFARLVRSLPMDSSLRSLCQVTAGYASSEYVQRVQHPLHILEAHSDRLSRSLACSLLVALLPLQGTKWARTGAPGSRSSSFLDGDLNEQPESVEMSAALLRSRQRARC